MPSLKRPSHLALVAAMSCQLACTDSAGDRAQPATAAAQAGQGAQGSVGGASSDRESTASATTGSSGTDAGSGTAGSTIGGTGGSAAGSGGAGGTAGADGSVAGRSGSGGTKSADPSSMQLPKGEGTASADDRKLQASISMHAVPAGYEAHACVLVQLPNSESVWVNEIHTTVSSGSHHLIVDRWPSSSEPRLDAEPCAPNMGGDQTRLAIAQQPETRVTLPDGVAYRIEAHQAIWLQLHFINLRDQPLDIQGNVELMRARGVENDTPAEAHSLFTGTLTLTLPPRQKTTVTSFHIPGAPKQGKRHIFALTSHTHELGIRATIERVAAADAPAVMPLHESNDWAEPPLTQLMPALDWDQSTQDGLRLTCNYDNATDQTVHFGTGFHDEMCFMWLYYYDR